jgi:uncharacterized protein (DUF58 family)
MAGVDGADYAVDAGLALLRALQAGDRVGLIAFDREVRGFCAPRAQRRQLGVLIDVLRPPQPRPGEPDYRVVVRTLAARHRQRALLVAHRRGGGGAAIFTERSPSSGGATVCCSLQCAIARLRRSTPSAVPAMVSVSRRLVLSDLVRERETVRDARRGGVQSVDPARAITAAVLDRYLALRYGPER